MWDILLMGKLGGRNFPFLKFVGYICYIQLTDMFYVIQFAKLHFMC